MGNIITYLKSIITHDTLSKYYHWLRYKHEKDLGISIRHFNSEPHLIITTGPQQYLITEIKTIDFSTDITVLQSICKNSAMFSMDLNKLKIDQ